MKIRGFAQITLILGVIIALSILGGAGYFGFNYVKENPSIFQQNPANNSGDHKGNALSNAEIIDRLKPAIVYIETKEGSGSGMIFDDAGHILTNAHVVTGFKSATVKLSNGGSFSGTVVGRDEKLDLAVLKIDGRDLKSVYFGDSNSVVQGDEVFTFGYPFGLEGDVSFKEGTISRKLEDEGVTYLETSAEIHPGNSGGALVNKNGEVIGVNTAVFGNLVVGISVGETIKLAIPINDAKNILEDLKNGRNVVKAKIIPLSDFVNKTPPPAPPKPPPTPVKIPPPPLPPPIVTCNGSLFDLQRPTNGTYSMYSLHAQDSYIRFESNDIKLTGIIKNNSQCVVEEIKLKVTIRDPNNAAVVQEEIITLNKSTSGYFDPELSIIPGSTAEYVGKVTAFSVFTQNVYSYSVRSGTELKSGVTVLTQIYDAKFLPSN